MLSCFGNDGLAINILCPPKFFSAAQFLHFSIFTYRTKAFKERLEVFPMLGLGLPQKA